MSSILSIFIFNFLFLFPSDFPAGADRLFPRRFPLLRLIVAAQDSIDAHIADSLVVPARLAQEAFDAGRTEDTAYFEPFYLKDFMVTTSKKKLF